MHWRRSGRGDRSSGQGLRRGKPGLKQRQVIELELLNGGRAAIDIDFEAIVASSPNPYVLLDPDLTIVAMSDAYLRATMNERADILGRNMFDASPSDEDSDSHRQLRGSLMRVLASGEPDEIAHIQYDIRNPDGSLEPHHWSATHTPLFGPEGNLAYVLQHTVNITEVETLRRMRDETGVIEREVFGRTVAEAVPEVAEQGFIAILDQVFASGEPYFGQLEKVIFIGAETEQPRETYLEFIFQPIRDERGIVTGIFIQGHDVTEQIEADDLRGLIVSSLEAAAGLDVERCRLDGPDVTRPPQFAVTLAMTTPSRAGFGTRLVRRGFGGQGRVPLDYRPTGLHCQIEATL